MPKERIMLKREVSRVHTKGLTGSWSASVRPDSGFHSSKGKYVGSQCRAGEKQGGSSKQIASAAARMSPQAPSQGQQATSSRFLKAFPTQCHGSGGTPENHGSQISRECGLALCAQTLRQVVQMLAAAAKSLQSCPTLCDPIDGSLPGSTVPGILQTGTLEWVAISFSNAWKWKVKVKSLSPVRPSATPPRTAAFQSPPSMGFSRLTVHCSKANKQGWWKGKFALFLRQANGSKVDSPAQPPHCLISGQELL